MDDRKKEIEVYEETLKELNKRLKHEKRVVLICGISRIILNVLLIFIIAVFIISLMYI